MSPGLLSGLSTLAAMLAFVAVAAWAWSRAREERFREAARLALEEDEDAGGNAR